jgi:glycosyltransferase involved in cell wall biosynthesis
MPHRDFLLIGRGWQAYDRFPELSALPNFQYSEAPYDAYPELYAQMDVFVSPARLEGGPIPLVEAMMSNAVPVASRTGFAPDLIRHGENGFLFDTEAPTAVICDLIEKAYSLQGDIRATALHCSWDNFAQGIQDRMAITGEAHEQGREE